VGSGTGSGTGTDGGTPTGVCDVGHCGTCLTSHCVVEFCLAEYDTCNANPECFALYECRIDCSIEDTACYDQCEADHPGGVDDLYTLYACILCQACYLDCDGASSEYCQ
jgi:hypothetical protein